MVRTKEPILMTETLYRENQGQPPQKAKKRRTYKYLPNSNSPFKTSLLIFPMQFIHGFLVQSIQTLEIQIAETLNVEVTDIQWIIHAENAVLCLMCLLSTRIYYRFNIQLVYLIACYTITASNICLGFFANQLVVFVIFRIISAIGLGIALPTLVPFSNLYSYKDKLASTLLINDLLIPLSYVFGTLGTGYLIQYIHYQYLFFIAAGMELIHSIYITVMLPIRCEHHRNVIFDIISISLLAIFVSASIVGLGLLSFQGAIYYAVSAILLALSLAALFSFYYYNKKCSKHQLIPAQVFNQNTKRFIAAYFISATCAAAQAFYQPIIWQQIFGLDIRWTGVYIGSCKICNVLSMAFVPCLIRRIIIRYIVSYCIVLQAAYFLALGVTLALPHQTHFQYVLLTFDIMTSVIQIAITASTQYYNVVHTPKYFAPISTSIISFSGRFCLSLGTAFGTAVQSVFTQIEHIGPRITGISIAIVYFICIVILLLTLLISFRIGVFDWERGKLGFQEKYLHGFGTYEELRRPIERKYITVDSTCPKELVATTCAQNDYLGSQEHGSLSQQQ